MVESYPATYKDHSGEEISTLENDGTTLSLTVRGVTFSGRYFDSLECQIQQDSPELDSFNLNQGELVDCEIEVDIPLSIVSGEEIIQGNLGVHFKLGKALPNGAVDNESLQLALSFKDQIYYSCGEHGWFEDELLEIQKALPQDTFMICCFNCAYSDYFPGGSGVFGDLACFRDNKAEYLKVMDKDDLFVIWDSMTAYVQETYVCPEFERRVPGAGYRG